MGSAHPTWLERATPEEIKEITEIDRSIADLRRRRSMLLNRTKMRTQVWIDHRLPSTDRRARNVSGVALSGDALKHPRYSRR